MKLYKVNITSYPMGALLDDPRNVEYSIDNPDWTPAGWLEDGLARAEWIKRHGDTRFFWPSTKRLYQSRSGAEARAALIRSYGATVDVIESDEIVWLTPEIKRERKIAELRAEIARLESPRLTAVAS